MAAKNIQDSQQLPYGVRLLNPAHADPWYGPYDDIAQANLTVPAALRNVDYEAGKYYPRTVGIRTIDGPKEYWWKNNNADGSLVLKTEGGGGGSGPTSGNLTTVDGTQVHLGGNADRATELLLGIFPWLLSGTGVKIQIDSDGNIILKTEGTKYINIQSDFGVNLFAPNLLISTPTEDNTKTRMLAVDNTGKILRRDASTLGRLTFIDLDDTENVNYTTHKGAFPTVVTDESGLKLARKQNAQFSGDGATTTWEIVGFVVYDIWAVFVGGVYQHNFDPATDFNYGTNIATLSPAVANDVLITVVFLGVLEGDVDTLTSPTLVAEPVSVDQINLSWNNVSSGANYVLQTDDNPSFTSPTTLYNGTNLSFDHIGLVVNTTYYYRVKAQKSGFIDSAYDTESAKTFAGSKFLGENLYKAGDSYMVGQGSTTGNSTGELLESYLQAGSVTSYAEGGKGVYKMASSFNALFNEFKFGTVVTMVPGFNDRRRSGTNAKTTEKIRGGYKIALMNIFSKKFYEANTFTQSGFWSNVGGGTFGNKFASPNNAGSATLETTINGKNFGIAFLGNSGNSFTFGNLQILVDGVEVFNSSMNNKSDGISDGVYNNEVTPYGIFVLGLTDGPHDFEFISTDSTPIDYIVELVDYPLNYANLALVSGLPLMPTAGYDVEPDLATPELIEADSDLIESIVEELSPYFPVTFIDISDLNPATDFDPDNVHLNDSGYLKIYNKMIASFAINNEFRVFNELFDMVFWNNYYESRNPSTWQAYGLSGLYLPAATNGYVQVDIDNLTDGDFGIIGLNSSDTLETYTGFEYGGALYEGDIRRLTSGADFTIVQAGPLSTSGRIRLGRFSGSIKLQYAADGSTYIDLHNWGVDVGAYYLGIAMVESKRAYNVITSGFVTKP